MFNADRKSIVSYLTLSAAVWTIKSAYLLDAVVQSIRRLHLPIPRKKDHSWIMAAVTTAVQISRNSSSNYKILKNKSVWNTIYFKINFILSFSNRTFRFSLSFFYRQCAPCAWTVFAIWYSYAATEHAKCVVIGWLNVQFVARLLKSEFCFTKISCLLEKKHA